MNKLIVILLFSFSVPLQAQTLRINGFVENTESGKVFLYRIIDPWTFHLFDSALIVDHAFSWEGRWGDPEVMFVQVSGQKIKRIFLEAGDVNLKFFRTGLMEVKGSKHHDLLIDYNTTIKKRKQSLDSLNELPRSSRPQQLTSAVRREIDEYYKKNRSTYFGTWLAFNDFNDQVTCEQIDSTLSLFSDSLRQTYYLTRLKEEADKMRSLALGTEAPLFSLNDTSGKETPLIGLRGKYVLVDFWASWCGPCREENQKLATLYPRLTSKLTILSVSVDTDKAKWEEAILKDKATWLHVSDLKGFMGPVAKLYQVRFVPKNILLDEGGRIIARNVKADQLDTLINRER